MKNLGIVIVDMQDRFRSCMMNNFNELMEAHKNTIQFGKENNLPIFYLEYQIEGSHRDPKIMTIQEIKNELGNYSKTKRIRKYSDNGFFAIKDNRGNFLPYEEGNYFLKGENLFDLELKKEKINKIIFTGVNRSSCVLETASEAKNRGYSVYTSKDLMNNPVEKDRFTDNVKYFNSHKELIYYFSKGIVTKFFDKPLLSPKNSH